MFYNFESASYGFISGWHKRRRGKQDGTAPFFVVKIHLHYNANIGWVLLREARASLPP